MHLHGPSVNGSRALRMRLVGRTGREVRQLEHQPNISKQNLRSPIAATGRRAGMSLALAMRRAVVAHLPCSPARTGGTPSNCARALRDVSRAGGRAPRRRGLPKFVDSAFRGFLTCGCLAAGFARFRCAGCRHERLVAFSCKGRGFCPSCGGRRMTERAAHLVDYVFPDVSVRQWVLTLPSRVRYALAWDPALCRAVVAVFVRAVLGRYRRHARRRGISNGRGVAGAIFCSSGLRPPARPRCSGPLAR